MLRKNASTWVRHRNLLGHLVFASGGLACAAALVFGVVAVSPVRAALTCGITGDTPGIAVRTLTGKQGEAALWDIIFIGTVTGLTPVNGDGETFGYSVDLTVEFAYRGVGLGPVEVHDGPSSSGFQKFAVGRRYLVAGFRDAATGELSTHECTATQEIESQAELARLIQVADPPFLMPDTSGPSATSATSDGPFGRDAAGAALALALGGTAAVGIARLVRRREREATRRAGTR